LFPGFNELYTCKLYVYAKFFIVSHLLFESLDIV
jgi:hypothetical protein